MKTKALRTRAPVFGLIGLAVLAAPAGALAQGNLAYTSPAKWNNFYPASLFAPQQGGSDAEMLPVPVPEDNATGDALSAPSPLPMGNAMTDAGGHAMSMGEACCQSTGDACGGAGRLPLRPCFASLNLLFLSRANDDDCRIAAGVGSGLADAVDTGMTPGFEAEIGRYLHDGQYGIGVSYLLWNPESIRAEQFAAAGTMDPGFPAYRDLSIDVQGNGEDTVYNYITGAGPGAGATSVRVYRDQFIQGIEANLYCFGLMGSRRVSRLGCNTPGCLGIGDALCGGCYGYGGANGPLTRPCGGRVSVMASHGFRWLQIKDRLDFDYNIDGQPGFQEGDLYECYHAENNLFGYQLGSQLTYCINACWSFNIGGQFGIYGNHATLMHQLGSTTLAYTTATDELIRTRESDNTLATLGELDISLGRRIGCAWTVRGGYRLYGITGIATGPGSIIETYANVGPGGAFCADDSLVLHGGYVGLNYNW